MADAPLIFISTGENLSALTPQGSWDASALAAPPSAALTDAIHDSLSDGRPSDGRPGKDRMVLQPSGRLVCYRHSTMMCVRFLGKVYLVRCVHYPTLPSYVNTFK